MINVQGIVLDIKDITDSREVMESKGEPQKYDGLFILS